MDGFDRVVILETAGRVGRVALATGDTLLADSNLAEARRRASDLAAVLAGLLSAQGWSPRELTAVVVGLGPGSYTGLRVGLASAKALVYATGARFLGVETYSAIAVRAPAEATRVSVFGDALQGRLFHRAYERTDHWKPCGPLEVVESARWLESLQAGSMITGPAAGLLEERLPTQVTVVAPDHREPRPQDLLTVARTMPWAVSTDVWTAEPLYGRGSSAEEKAAGRTR